MMIIALVVIILVLVLPNVRIVPQQAVSSSVWVNTRHLGRPEFT